jgi:transcriptional regulator with XRE-family HTH domain
MNHTGRLLMQKRVRLGLTQLDVSSRFGFTTSQFISNLELGKSPVPTDKVKPLCKMLDIPIKEFIGAYIKDLKVIQDLKVRNIRIQL